MKKHFLFIISFFIVLPTCFFSCTKEDNSDTNLFYGSWKTSYGDTIVFSRVNNKNMLYYDASMNPSLPIITNSEYTGENNKLGIKNGWSGPDTFHFYQSFRWLQKGSSFEVQGIQWFPFLSSTLTYFTFTKIP